MADVQIAVWLGRKTGLDGCMFAAFEVFFDKLFTDRTPSAAMQKTLNERGVVWQVADPVSK